MIRRLISLIFMVVVCLMGYNMFFGTEADKERGRAVAKETREAVGSIFNLLKAEKENYDAGKFDGAVSKLNSAFVNISQKAQEIGGNFPERMEKLQEKKDQLEALIEVNKNSKVADSKKQNDEIQDEMNDLLRDLESIAKDIEKQ